MKTINIILALLLLAGQTFASSVVVKSNKGSSPTIQWLTTDIESISVLDGDDPLILKTRNATFKIYPCGKVEMSTWKQINPNMGDGEGGLIDISSGEVITDDLLYDTYLGGTACFDFETGKQVDCNK